MSVYYAKKNEKNGQTLNFSRLSQTKKYNLVRQFDRNSRPLLLPALNVDAPAVVADDFMDDGKPEAGSARAGGERFEKVFE